MKLLRILPLILLTIALTGCDKNDQNKTSNCNCSGSYYRFSAGGSNVSFPSAFTPNGDGRNDVFRAIASNIDDASFQLVIYDQNGDEQFATSDRNEAWDGQLRGGGYANGRYEAQFSFRTPSGTAISTCHCFYALIYDEQFHCLRATPGSYTFADQFDTFGGEPLYQTTEYLCP